MTDEEINEGTISTLLIMRILERHKLPLHYQNITIIARDTEPHLSDNKVLSILSRNPHLFRKISTGVYTLNK